MVSFFQKLLTALRKRSAWQDFISRIPKGSSVVVSGDGFDYEGQVLGHDSTFLIISDAESLQLVRVAKINNINYVLPDVPLEIVA